MKKYIKPEIKQEKILNSQTIASTGLAGWIEEKELTYGITVHSYVIES